MALHTTIYLVLSVVTSRLPPYYNYWVSGLHAPCNILKTREQNLSGTRTGPVSETLFSLVFRILNDGQSPKTQ
jgi:hypothetical protein